MSLKKTTKYGSFCARWQTKVDLTNGKTYCPYDALSLALISGLCYEEQTKSNTTNFKLIDHQLSNWGFDTTEHFQASHSWDIDTQGILATNEKRTLIAFRGTDSKEDWRTNLQLTKEPGPFDGAFVHKGIQEAFFHVALDIGKLLERHHSDDKELWITGHSLGGALGVILAAHLASRDIEIDGLYTFAAPRVGDDIFSSALDSKLTGLHVRIVNEHDMVPYLPLEALFSHSGNLLVLTESGPNLSEVTPNLFNTLKANLSELFQQSTFGQDSPFIDHHMLWTNNGYVNKLKKAVKQLDSNLNSKNTTI